MDNQQYDDIIVRLSCDFDSEVTESHLIRWIVDIYLYDEEFEVSNPGVPGRHIGKGSLTYYDAIRYSSFDLRMIAQVHGANSGEFQVLNSVRIFSDEQELIQFIRGDKSVINDIDEGVLDPTDFTPDELEAIKNWERYDEECTANVFGRLVSLEDLEISPNYQNFSRNIVQKISEFFEKIGIDFILVMPVPFHSNSLDEVSYKRQTKDVINIYESLDFELTKGKLYDYCMVKKLS
ncbi:hypothetical protein P4662_16190 [Priestia megaterium]|nr:hypothetical protein [Priestia megaterium]